MIDSEETEVVSQSDVLWALAVEDLEWAGFGRGSTGRTVDLMA